MISAPGLFFSGFDLVFLIGGIANFVLLLILYRRYTHSSTMIWILLYFTLMVGIAFSQLFQSLLSAPGQFEWIPIFNLNLVILLPPVFLSFVLNYVNDEKTVGNYIYIVILASMSLILLMVAWNSNILVIHDFARAHLTPWGYQLTSYPSSNILAAWYAAVYLPGIVYLYRYAKRIGSQLKKRQVGLFIIAILLPVIVGAVVQGVLPNFIRIDPFPISIPAQTFSCAIITYAILRYGLFNFNHVTLAPSILETMSESVIGIDTNFRLQFINKETEHLLGWKSNDVLGEPLKKIIGTSDGLTRIKDTTHDMTSKTAELADTSVLSSVETPIPVSIFITRVVDNAGRTEGYILVMTDLTTVKESYHALEAEKASVEHKVDERTQEVLEGRTRLVASINSIPMGFILTDKQGSVQLMNDRAHTLLCVAEGESGLNHDQSHSLGCTLDDITQRLEPSINLHQEITEAIQALKPRELSDVPLGKAILRIYASPILLNKAAIGAVIILEDVTEARILERSKDEFFSIASHELRTPLAIIRGNISLIQSMHKDEMKNKDLANKVDTIHASANRLIDIVNEFLNLSRLEQGSALFKSEPIDILAVIQSAKKELAVLGKEKGVTLVVDDPQSPVPLVLADIERVKEVLNNLVGNAFKFTAKGSISIAASKKDDHFVMVQVRDTGEGIPLENQSLLFHKFQQAGSSILTRDASGGTGLGLYISKLIVHAMGGDIYLEHSDPHKGSTFTFTLPIADGKQKQPASASTGVHGADNK